MSVFGGSYSIKKTAEKSRWNNSQKVAEKIRGHDKVRLIPYNPCMVCTVYIYLHLPWQDQPNVGKYTIFTIHLVDFYGKRRWIIPYIHGSYGGPMGVAGRFFPLPAPSAWHRSLPWRRGLSCSFRFGGSSLEKNLGRFSRREKSVWIHILCIEHVDNHWSYMLMEFHGFYCIFFVGWFFWWRIEFIVTFRNSWIRNSHQIFVARTLNPAIGLHFLASPN